MDQIVDITKLLALLSMTMILWLLIRILFKMFLLLEDA